MGKALATIARTERHGMISIRADLARAGDAIAEAAGLTIPDTTRFTTDGTRWLGWLSPDELLLMVPEAEALESLAALEQALTGEHALVLDVSDMRADFTIAGDKADQVLAKLCPVDFATLGTDTLRRTRAAQVAVALWRGEAGLRVICFRSVADYVETILTNAALPGTDLDPR